MFLATVLVGFFWVEVICFCPPVTPLFSVSPSATPPALYIRLFGSRIFPCGSYLIGQPSIAISLWTRITRYGERVESGDRKNTHFRWLSHLWIAGRPEWPRLKGPPGRMVSGFSSHHPCLSISFLWCSYTRYRSKWTSSPLF